MMIEWAKNFEKTSKTGAKVTIKLKKKPVRRKKKITPNQLANMLGSVTLVPVRPANRLANLMGGMTIQGQSNNWHRRHPIMNFPPPISPRRTRSPPPNRNNWSRNSTPRKYNTLGNAYPNLLGNELSNYLLKGRN